MKVPSAAVSVAACLSQDPQPSSSEPHPSAPALRSFPPASRQGRAVSGPPRSHPAHTEEKSIFREVPLRSENFSYRKSDPFGEQETGKDVESAETREYTLPKTKECKIKV